jgi:hypothetical protein
MEIKRGTPPTHVDRELIVDMGREEILNILSFYVKKKINNDLVKLDNIEVVGSADGQLESMTLVGVESIPLKWKEVETKE